MDTFILVQILGVIIIILGAISFQMRTKAGILSLQIAGNAIYVIQFLLLNQATGVVIAFLALLRCIAFYIYAKKGFQAPFALFVIFAIVTVGTGVWTLKSWLDILPIMGMICATFAYWHKNITVTRSSSVASCTFFAVYNFYLTLYTSGFNEVVLGTSALVALWRYRKKEV